MIQFIYQYRKTFLIYLCIVVSLFLVSSYYYFLNDYKKLELQNNQKHIQYLITKIDNQFQIFNKNSNEVKKVANSYEYLLKNSSMIDFFKTLDYTDNKPLIKNQGLKLNTENFQNIRLKTNTDELLINTIEYYDNSNNYLFTLQTSNDRNVVNAGKNSILIFMLLVLCFVIIVFIMIQKYFDAIRSYNKKLEEQVEKRTSQMQSTLMELEKANLKLYDMAHTDFLTKIRNRRNFFIHSENLFANAVRKNKDLSIIMIDIDNFKPLNDTYGHNMGDRALKEFTKCVETCLNEKDIFGRLGGEEFAIALYDINLYDAIEKAEKIRVAIESIVIPLENTNIKLTASFGVSDIRGCKDLDQMIHKADGMLYSAKHSGKNRVRSRLSKY